MEPHGSACRDKRESDAMPAPRSTPGSRHFQNNKNLYPRKFMATKSKLPHSSHHWSQDTVVSGPSEACISPGEEQRVSVISVSLPPLWYQ
jgi:hypothetical protein